jgi:hypothetical protein
MTCSSNRLTRMVSRFSVVIGLVTPVQDTILRLI